MDPPRSPSCDKFLLTGFAIITMNHPDGKPLRRKYSQGYEIPAAVLEKVRIALTHMHDGGFVFGGLRWPNVLVTKVEGYNSVQLMDLDCAGTQGRESIQYPPNVNLVDAR